MKEIKFFIPGKCIPKLRPRFARIETKKKKFVQTYTSKVTRIYENKVSLFANKYNIPDQPLEVELEFNFKRPKSASKRIFHNVKPDIDNLIKSTLDGLRIKDQIIYRLSALKQYSDYEGVLITIKYKEDK